MSLDDTNKLRVGVEGRLGPNHIGISYVQSDQPIVPSLMVSEPVASAVAASDVIPPEFLPQPMPPTPVYVPPPMTSASWWQRTWDWVRSWFRRSPR